MNNDHNMHQDVPRESNEPSVSSLGTQVRAGIPTWRTCFKLRDQALLQLAALEREDGWGTRTCQHATAQCVKALQDLQEQFGVDLAHLDEEHFRQGLHFEPEAPGERQRYLAAVTRAAYWSAMHIALTHARQVAQASGQSLNAAVAQALREHVDAIPVVAGALMESAEHPGGQQAMLAILAAYLITQSSTHRNKRLYRGLCAAAEEMGGTWFDAFAELAPSAAWDAWNEDQPTTGEELRAFRTRAVRRLEEQPPRGSRAAGAAPAVVPARIDLDLVPATEDFAMREAVREELRDLAEEYGLMAAETEILQLRAEGYKLREIAELRGCAPGTVASLLARVKKKRRAGR